MPAWILAAALLLPASPALTAALPVPQQQEQRAADEEDDRPRDGLPATEDAARKVRRFLDHFVDPDKTPEEQADLFTERAEYYGHGYADHEDIVRDVERYVKHWPKRRYEVTDIDFMTADPDSDRIFVSYTIAFEVARGTQTVKGKASYAAVIKDIDGEPKVEFIKEKVHPGSSGSNE